MVGEITIEVTSADDLRNALNNINLDSGDVDAFRFRLKRLDSIEGAKRTLDELTDVLDRSQYNVEIAEIMIEVRS